MKAKMTELTQVAQVAITTDLWTSRDTKSYIGSTEVIRPYYKPHAWRKHREEHWWNFMKCLHRMGHFQQNQWSQQRCAVESIGPGKTYLLHGKPAESLSRGPCHRKGQKNCEDIWAPRALSSWTWKKTKSRWNWLVMCPHIGIRDTPCCIAMWSFTMLLPQSFAWPTKPSCWWLTKSLPLGPFDATTKEESADQIPTLGEGIPNCKAIIFQCFIPPRRNL